MANTFDLRFHVHEEGLFVITLRKLLLIFFCLVTRRFLSVLSIIVYHRPQTCAPKT